VATLMRPFELHPVLAADTLPVTSLDVAELLLMNDARFPWCILVPRLVGLSEWHHLPADARLPFMQEIDVVSRALLELPGITKINVGALGNRVAQLHVHVLGRHPEDAAWPGPVWGFGTPEPYQEKAARARLSHLRARMAGSR
jgi:diadenosine tetraphosphate (Ap4A) HIT family hydrolase